MDHLQVNRRACLPVLAGTIVATLPVRADTLPSWRSFVLVHGAWFGGWCWTEVAAYLRGKGHRVFTPSLTGLGDRAHLAGPGVTLSTHVADVLDVLQSEELRDVILVAHSYAGVPCAMAAAQAADRIGRLVFLDSVLPEDGKPLSALSAPDVWEARLAAARMTPSSGFAPPPIAAFGVTDPKQIAWLQRQLRPQPIGTYLEAPRLTASSQQDTVYVSCEGPTMAASIRSVPPRAHARTGASKPWRRAMPA